MQGQIYNTYFYLFIYLLFFLLLLLFFFFWGGVFGNVAPNPAEGHGATQADLLGH